MTCPICGGNTAICVTRKDCESVHRRRKCYDCKHIFYTSEYESDSSRLYEIERERNSLRRETKKHNKNITKTG